MRERQKDPPQKTGGDFESYQTGVCRRQVSGVPADPAPSHPSRDQGRRGRQGAGRQAFVDMVLDSLDRGQSLRDLNLRGIARELGCAHTNAYNWFPRQEDLYWQALGEAIQRLVRPYENLAPEDIPHPLGENSLFEGYIRYAFAHPAWFRLIWQEILEPPPPPDLPPVLDRPRRIMGAWLRYHVGPAMPEGELEERARILTGCLQGELGALVSNRIDPAAKENTPEEIASRVRRLYRLLFGALQPVAADAEPGTEIAAGSGPA